MLDASSRPPGGPPYTRGGAEAELGRLDCARDGHDLEVMLGGFFLQPKAAYCRRPCGHPGWVLVPADQPQLWLDLSRVIGRTLAAYPSALEAVNTALDDAMRGPAVPRQRPAGE